MVNQTAYNSLRQHAPRLALALLFQPERQKATLSTLLLLGLEFDRIAAQVSEPMLAMIRLQWWQDQLDTDNASAGPLAAHLKNQLLSGELTAEDISSLLVCWRQSIELGMSDSADNWAQLIYLMSVKAGLSGLILQKRLVGLSLLAGQDSPSMCQVLMQFMHRQERGANFLSALRIWPDKPQSVM